MKRANFKGILSITICLTLLFVFSVPAHAAITANPIFVGGYVIVDDALGVELHAQTKADCDNISVNSIYLQRVNSTGSVIYSSTSIPNPTSSVGNSTHYYAWLNCASYATSGNYYRLSVTFIADGVTMTISSRIVHYN